MKKIILILIFIAHNSFSQNSIEKSELNKLKTISKTNRSKDTLKNTSSVLNEPVLSHFGIKKDNLSIINDSIIPKVRTNKQTSKTLEPKLLKAQSFSAKKDTIPQREKNIKE